MGGDRGGGKEARGPGAWGGKTFAQDRNKGINAGKTPGRGPGAWEGNTFMNERLQGQAAVDTLNQGGGRLGPGRPSITGPATAAGAGQRGHGGEGDDPRGGRGGNTGGAATGAGEAKYEWWKYGNAASQLGADFKKNSDKKVKV